MLRARPVERPRPDPQGTDVRPDQRRGQPRRGRQGVLLLPRQHAHPLVHEVPVQVPAGEFPYADLVDTNKARGRRDFEYELLDTGIFDEDRYFDVFVEYAKTGPEDLLIEITAHNRGPDEATLHLLPTLWFRHTWSWAGGTAVPSLRQTGNAIRADHEELGPRWLYSDTDAPALFTENETDNERIFGSANSTPYVKDGIHRHVVHGDTTAVNPAQTGTKAAVHHTLTVPAGDSATLRLRLSDTELTDPWAEFGATMDMRRTEADAFYEDVVPDGMGEDERRLVRQALAGMLWSKQYYYLDVERWLAEHGVDPLSADPGIRNSAWYHMVNDEVMSMPDAWEYPWFAAWDLAFHTLALSMVDIGFAKGQLELLLRRLYLHPNGQIPAYEWNFGDVNPPVHAWAVLFVYELEKHRTGHGDRAFLENAFQKLTKNFTWWLNRKDVDGNNVFQGGFLGLDNIGVFDRSAPLPTGGHLDQADGTAWMALYCQNLLDIAIELAVENPVYVEQAQMLFEHFAWIAVAMNRIGKDNASLWDEEDGFFYDVLRLPDGSATRLKVRSLVGLIPLAATSVIGGRTDRSFPNWWREQGVHQEAPGRRGLRVTARHRGSEHRRTLSVRAVRRGPAAPHPGPHARRGGVPRPARHPFPVPPPRRPPIPLRRERPDVRRRLSARGVRLRHVRRQLQLARPGVVPDKPPPDPRPAEPARLPRPGLHRGVPDRLRAADEPVRGRPRDLRPAHLDLPGRGGRPPPGARRPAQVRQGPALEGPDPLLRVLPRRQRRGPRRLPPDRLDRAGGRHRDALPRHQRRRMAPRRPGVPAARGLHGLHGLDELRELRGRRTVHGLGRGGALVMTVIHEINTLVWLGELSGRYGRRVTLGEVPAEVWDEVARPGVDTVWLMGVWERSPAGLAIALRDESLRASFRDALPDLTEADIAGSPYCVRNYVVDAGLGGPDGLAEARAQLAARGVRLILDYVPNHVAPDHPGSPNTPSA